MSTYHEDTTLDTDTNKAKNGLADQAREHIDTQMEAAREVTDKAAAAFHDATKDAPEKALGFVRENPGVALAGAVGVGMLIGLAMRTPR